VNVKEEVDFFHGKYYNQRKYQGSGECPAVLILSGPEMRLLFRFGFDHPVIEKGVPDEVRKLVCTGMYFRLCGFWNCCDVCYTDEL
jgi:hypothetical protein